MVWPITDIFSLRLKEDTVATNVSSFFVYKQGWIPFPREYSCFHSIILGLEWELFLYTSYVAFIRNRGFTAKEMFFFVPIFETFIFFRTFRENIMNIVVATLKLS